MSTRRLVQGLLLLAGFSISACTAILVPGVDDDKVNRCNTSADCPEIDDNRYEAVCTSGEGQSDNSDQVCSSTYTEIECGQGVLPGDSTLEEAYAAAEAAKANYGGCDTESLGKQGCGQPVGGCLDGLEPNEDNICDVSNPDIPAINAGDVGLSDIAGQDVADQFCRNYFCDERFVCDRSRTIPICVVCDSTRADDYGAGGCGTLYINGEMSTFYTDVEGTGNCSGTADRTMLPFGDAPAGAGG